MSAQKPQAPSCPLPISTTQLAQTLIRLHARLRGELAKAEDDEELLVDRETAQAMMAHIEPLLSFLAIDFDPKKLKPIRTRPKISPLSYGDLRVEVLATLRAASDWMTYPAIAEVIITKHTLTLEPKRKKHFLQKLREATHALAQQGAVERESSLKLGQTATLQRWRLSSKLFRPR